MTKFFHSIKKCGKKVFIRNFFLLITAIYLVHTNIESKKNILLKNIEND